MGVPVVSPVLKRVFGTRNERLVKRYLRIVDQVSALEGEISTLTDAQLRARTDEFRKRIKAVRVFMETDPVPVEIDETYGLDDFVRQAYDPVRAARCEKCYTMRLLRTAERARGRFDAFSTTLLVSKHQDHERVRAVGERVAEETGVRFLYRDWRALAEEGHAEAKRRSLYRQAYCGCCWSEWERYRDTTRELYRGPGGPRGEKGG